MSSAEGYTMAPRDPTLDLGLLCFVTTVCRAHLPPYLCLCCSPAPCQANVLSSGCSGLSQTPTFLTGLWPQSPLGGPPKGHEDPMSRRGHSHPGPPQPSWSLTHSA